jgi:hypothetical protein
MVGKGIVRGNRCQSKLADQQSFQVKRKLQFKDQLHTSALVKHHFLTVSSPIGVYAL